MPMSPCRADVLPAPEPFFPDSEPVEVKQVGVQDHDFQNLFVLDYD
jgi:hypothetical protein